MFMEELEEAINNIGMVSKQLGMSAQEFYEFLQKLATEPIVVSEHDIKVDEDRIWIIPATKKPIKLVIEKEDVMKIDFDA